MAYKSLFSLSEFYARFVHFELALGHKANQIGKELERINVSRSQCVCVCV